MIITSSLSSSHLIHSFSPRLFYNCYCLPSVPLSLFIQSFLPSPFHFGKKVSLSFFHALSHFSLFSLLPKLYVITSCTISNHPYHHHDQKNISMRRTVESELTTLVSCHLLLSPILNELHISYDDVMMNSYGCCSVDATTFNSHLTELMSLPSIILGSVHLFLYHVYPPPLPILFLVLNSNDDDDDADHHKN